MRPYVSNNGEFELTQTKRIVGGQEAMPNSHPSICSFRMCNGFGNNCQHICGSTLVKNLKNEWYLVTAAHCISELSLSRYEASCGIHSIDPLASNPYQVTVKFDRGILHGRYDASTMANDIAVFRVGSPMPDIPEIQPACIADEDNFEREASIVAGWGTLSSGGQMAERLKQVVKPIKSDDQCEQRLFNAYDSTNMMCAGDPNGGVDACQGDSGGPLYTLRGPVGQKRWYLTGVVSWGYGCAAPQNPGVYADVYQLRSWIDSAINEV